MRTPEKSSELYFSGESDWEKKPKQITLEGHKIYYLFDYYPHGQVPTNEFLKTANRYLKDLKTDNSRKREAAENWLAKLLAKRAPIDQGWYWSYVPSSDPRSRFTGARAVAQIMSDRNITSPKPKILERRRRIVTKEELPDGTIKKIPRTVKEHEETLGLADNRALSGMKIVLLDDVVTSGATMIACRNVLLNADVRDVMMIGLGLTLKHRN